MTSKRSRPTSPATGPSRPTKRVKRKKTAESRSIWNSADDWDTLVEQSTLSTSSVSTRRPPPGGLLSLVRCCQNVAARHFKHLWEDGSGEGEWWKAEWAWVGERQRDGLRDRIYGAWGGYLTADILRQVFAYPPHLYLTAALLPVVAAATHLKPLRPAEKDWASVTRLTLKNAAKATDVAVAGLIVVLPNLEEINLKGCALAGPKTVDTILKHVPRLRRINLKSTTIGEAEVKKLLNKYGKQLEGFKVDDIHFEKLNDTLAAAPFPKITHLCLPGGLLNTPPSGAKLRARARALGQLAYPTPRPTPADSILRWETFFDVFPAVTHLYLPGLLIPADTSLQPSQDRLIKFHTAPGGPPLPLNFIIDLINNQASTLEAVHLGHLHEPANSSREVEGQFIRLGSSLSVCDKLRDLRLQVDPRGSGDSHCDAMMTEHSHELLRGLEEHQWSRTLKRLTISLPVSMTCLLPRHNYTAFNSPALEILEMSGVRISDEARVVEDLKKLRNLRQLDISSTRLTGEQVFSILDECRQLHRIDLTSCRGVDVRDRRNIFRAHKEARAAQS